ncbi:PREDICTED: kappa-casein [Chinchilla lanigera]|uniref:kappa-casein n=1 Tax=Chinchilla lanigera TaxID=34839 RepID=UPI000695CD81|nr:PREDICTED: kappa-casein [Chinchilla lanigera]
MMKTFLLVVNIVAITLPFLVTSQAAEVQNQEQLACCENDERLFNQKKVPYVLSHPMLNNYLHNALNYYQNRAVVPVNPYMCHPFYAQSFVLQPQAQIPKWPVLTNSHQPTTQPHRTRHSFMVIPPKKIPEKATLPVTETIAAPVPTPDPAAVPAVSPENVPEVPSEFIRAPEATEVPATSPVA